MKSSSLRAVLVLVVLVIGAAIWVTQPRDDTDTPLLVSVPDEGPSRGFSSPPTVAEDRAPVDSPSASTPGSASVQGNASPFRQRTSVQLWDSVYGGLESAILGGITSDRLAGLAEALLSTLDADAGVALGEGQHARVEYTLLDDAGRGTATLIHYKSSAAPNEFVIRASIASSPGYYTGYPEDGAEQTTMELSFGVTEDGESRHNGLLVQNQFHDRSDLAVLRDGKEPLGVGGIFTADAGGGQWRRVVVSAHLDDEGAPSWISRMEDPIMVDAGVPSHASRYDAIARRLHALRSN